MRDILWPTTVSNKYAHNLDYLIACIIYLATSRTYWARTPAALASDLSLDQRHVRTVLEGFPGLFRKSPHRDKKDAQSYFSLQARYTLWEASGDAELDVADPLPVLPNDTLKAVLDFVQKMAEHEILEARTRRTHTASFLVAVFAGLLAGLFAVYTAGIRASSTPSQPSSTSGSLTK